MNRTLWLQTPFFSWDIICTFLSVCNTFLPSIQEAHMTDLSWWTKKKHSLCCMISGNRLVPYYLSLSIWKRWSQPCMMLMSVSVFFLKDNSQWLKEQCMRMGDAYIIVYSVTDKSSFEKASELRIQLRRARQSENIPIILVGNKSDLVRSREVTVDGTLIWLLHFEHIWCAKVI